MGDGILQLGELLAERRPDPTEPGCYIWVIDIHAIEKQHVKVKVEVQRSTEALDQSDRTATSRPVGEAWALAPFSPPSCGICSIINSELLIQSQIRS